MILFPAIDLKDGNCVRLFRGDMQQATVFHDNPAEQARIFQDQGFAWIHVVDLNGAVAGHQVNEVAISKILDVPLGTIKSRINRARLQLQEKLKSVYKDRRTTI